MKHLNNMACMLALLAAGTTGFTACSSDDAVEGGSKTPGAAGKMVKTSFALNIPYGTKSVRMTASNTQADGNNFRGMQDMRMLAFNTDQVAGNTAIKKIVLGTSNDAFDSDNYRRIYRDVTIPVGTKHFLFYGKTDAVSAETGADLMKEKFETGSIEDVTTELSSNPNSTTTEDKVNLSNINFKLETIHDTPFDGTAEGSSAKVVADALESVYNAKTTDKAWKDCKSTGDNVEKHAATLFAQFKGLTAGSAASAKAAIEALKKGCGRNTADDATGEKDDILMAVAKACDAATTALNNCTFPNDLGLPDGAAKGHFDENGTFAYETTGVITTGSTGLDYTKVTYPAALNYYVETPVKASDNAIENLNTTVNGWPSYENWKNDSYTWGDGWENEVTNNTRSIALQKAIQYAVASLQTNVTVTTSSLTDNAQDKGGMLKDQTINVSTKGFQLTGVLIGGQPSQVGYDYTPSASADFDRTVYDCVMNTENNSITSSNGGTTNYTLVLANEDKASIYVTLELVNNTGTDFYGADGLVPNGSKFYLVGQLNPTTDDNGNVAPDGNPKNLTQVFMKDHKTVANMKIGSNSLQKAYNTIPDLRSTQISLGLAVDLTWENGITFDVNL